MGHCFRVAAATGYLPAALRAAIVVDPIMAQLRAQPNAATKSRAHSAVAIFY